MHRRSFFVALALTPFVARVATAAELFAQTDEPENRRARAAMRGDHPLVGKIWDAASARFVGREVLVASLLWAHFRLLGEVHDNADHHAIQAELLEAIAEGGLKPIVAFEQMDREHDPSLQQRLARGSASAEDVAQAVSFDRKAWAWPHYRPLIEIALRHGLPLRAANLSRRAAAQIARRGMSAIDPARVAALRLEMGWTAKREQALREIIRDAHCGALPESAVPAMAAAQRTRDGTLAESLMLPENPDGAVLIAGNGHVRRDLGVPIYLAAASAGVSCSIGLIEVEANRRSPQAYLADHLTPATSAGPLYDFVWFTPRVDRPDPCAAFRK